MKKCLQCGRTYSDESLSFCTVDGTPLSASYYPGTTLPLLGLTGESTKTTRSKKLRIYAAGATLLILISLILALLFFGRDNNTNQNGAAESAGQVNSKPSPSLGVSPKPTSTRTASSANSVTESNQIDLEIVDYDGRSTFLSNPSIAYPSTFGPSKLKEGIAVRRGVEESVLLWSRIRTLRFKSRQEKNDKGISVWRHAVEAVLRDGKVTEVELKDDWNMAYMGGGGPGILFGQTDLGETQIPFSKISMLKVLR
jgi:hypothetical protein